MVVVLLFVYNVFHDRRKLLIRLQSLLNSSVKSYYCTDVWRRMLWVSQAEHFLQARFDETMPLTDEISSHITCAWKLAGLGQKIKAAALHRPSYGFFFFTCLWALLYAFLSYRLCRVFFCPWNNLISLGLPQTGIDVFDRFVACPPSLWLKSHPLCCKQPCKPLLSFFWSCCSAIYLHGGGKWKHAAEDGVENSVLYSVFFGMEPGQRGTSTYH